MRRTGLGTYAIVAILSACGGKVVVDLGAGVGAAGGGGAGGSGGAPTSACPVPPTDLDVQKLLGQPCGMEGEVCASNNGCGGCTILCVNGTWTQPNASLCFSIGNSC